MKDTEGVTEIRVARVVGQGGFWGRRHIAEAMNREKTTHVVNVIERAFSLGYIERHPGYVNGQSGYVYCVPGTQLELPSAHEW